MSTLFNDYVQSLINRRHPAPVPVKNKPLSTNWDIGLAIKGANGDVVYLAYHKPYEKNVFYGHCKTRAEYKTAILKELRRAGGRYLGEVDLDY